MDEEDDYGEWETQEGWTGIVCGLQELIVPVYAHCRRQIDAAEQAATTTSKKKKGRRVGGVKQRAQGRDAAEAENLLQNTLPANMLVELLKNAPTAHVCTDPAHVCCDSGLTASHVSMCCSGPCVGTFAGRATGAGHW